MDSPGREPREPDRPPNPRNPEAVSWGFRPRFATDAPLALAGFDLGGFCRGLLDLPNQPTDIPTKRTAHVERGLVDELLYLLFQFGLADPSLVVILHQDSNGAYSQPTLVLDCAPEFEIICQHRCPEVGGNRERQDLCIGGLQMPFVRLLQAAPGVVLD